MSKKNNNELIKCDDRNIDDIVNQEIERLGNNANLNHLDVSEVTDMTEVFYESDFNGDISKWDVSNVENMSLMFAESQFNGDISKWDVTKVKDTFDMFEGCLIKEENKPTFTNPKLKKRESKDWGVEEKDLGRYTDVIRKALEKSKNI